jgi:hypothetical protein
VCGRAGGHRARLQAHIVEETTAQGRWSAQREEDRRNSKLRKEILEYLAENGIPAESTSWQRLLHLWKRQVGLQSQWQTGQQNLKKLRAELREAKRFGGAAAAKKTVRDAERKVGRQRRPAPPQCHSVNNARASPWTRYKYRCCCFGVLLLGRLAGAGRPPRPPPRWR